jgi:hypothetical protein
MDRSQFTAESKLVAQDRRNENVAGIYKSSRIRHQSGAVRVIFSRKRDYVISFVQCVGPMSVISYTVLPSVQSQKRTDRVCA